jgi:hypothetical protein
MNLHPKWISTMHHSTFREETGTCSSAVSFHLIECIIAFIENSHWTIPEPDESTHLRYVVLKVGLICSTNVRQDLSSNVLKHTPLSWLLCLPYTPPLQSILVIIFGCCWARLAYSEPPRYVSFLIHIILSLPWSIFSIQKSYTPSDTFKNNAYVELFSSYWGELPLERGVSNAVLRLVYLCLYIMFPSVVEWYGVDTACYEIARCGCSHIPPAGPVQAHHLAYVKDDFAGNRFVLQSKAECKWFQCNCGMGRSVNQDKCIEIHFVLLYTGKEILPLCWNKTATFDECRLLGCSAVWLL